MKKWRSYNNLELITQDADLSDIILALLVIIGLSAIAFPLILIMAVFLLSTIIYVVINCLITTIRSRIYK